MPQVLQACAAEGLLKDSPLALSHTPSHFGRSQSLKSARSGAPAARQQSKQNPGKQVSECNGTARGARTPQDFQVKHKKAFPIRRQIGHVHSEVWEKKKT